MEHEYIIAHADKSVLKISGLEVKGLNTKQLEKILGDKLHTFVRVIGVTGNNIEMDVYDIEPEQVRKKRKRPYRKHCLNGGDNRYRAYKAFLQRKNSTRRL